MTTNFSSQLSEGESSAQVVDPAGKDLVIEDIWASGFLLSDIRFQLLVNDLPFSPWVEMDAGQDNKPMNKILPRDRNYPALILSDVLTFQVNRPLAANENFFVAGFSKIHESSSSAESSNTPSYMPLAYYANVTEQHVTDVDGVVKYGESNSLAYSPSNGDFTIEEDGVYTVMASATLGELEPGFLRDIAIYKNGQKLTSGDVKKYNPDSSGTADQLYLSVFTSAILVAGDKVMAVVEPGSTIVNDQGTKGNFSLFKVGEAAVTQPAP